MVQTVMLNRTNKKGVTLVEVLIALVILLIVFMGLISTSIVAIGANARNESRDEAVRVTSDQMSMLRVASFDSADLVTTAGVWVAMPNTGNRFTRQIRSATITYTIERLVVPLDIDHKEISLRASWIWQGETLRHTIVAYRGRS